MQYPIQLFIIYRQTEIKLMSATLILLYIRTLNADTLAAPSKASVCDRSLAETAGSNRAGAWIPVSWSAVC